MQLRVKKYRETKRKRTKIKTEISVEFVYVSDEWSVTPAEAVTAADAVTQLHSTYF